MAGRRRQRRAAHGRVAGSCVPGCTGAQGAGNIPQGSRLVRGKSVARLTAYHRGAILRDMTKSDLPAPGEDPPAIAVLKEIGLRPGAADTVQDSLTALLLKAVEALDLPEVRRIIEHGADVNARYCDHGIWCMGHEFVTPLMAAAKTSGALEIVRCLLSAGADARIEREWRVDVGYGDFKWEGTGAFESAAELAVEPEVRAMIERAAEPKNDR